LGTQLAHHPTIPHYSNLNTQLPCTIQTILTNITS